MNTARVEQNPFRQRGFPRIDVSTDPDIPCPLEGIAPGRINGGGHNRSLPAQMSKGAVGLRHPMRFIPFFHGISLSGCRITNLLS